MIKTIIIDDEQPAREYLEKLIDRYFPNKFAIVKKCANAAQGYEAIKEHNPDLVFLDIRMQEESGFEMLKRFEMVDFEVIFTTAHSQYALEAIKQSALDYLLKPIDYIDLRSAIKKYEKKTEYRNELDRIRLLLENLDIGNHLQPKIAFPCENGYKLVRSNTILYCKAEGNYTSIAMVDGSSFVLARTLKKNEEQLPSQLFLRIHKSYLVNLNYIKEYRNVDGNYVMLTNNERLPIASRKKTEVIEKILER